MSVLFYGVSLIILTFFIHLLLWKIRLPRHQTKALLEIFIGTLIAGIFVLWKFSCYIELFIISPPETIYEYFQLSLFFISLALGYIITYSAIEADSPSLVMVMTIADAGSKGLDKNVFEQKMNDDILVIPRIEDLIRDKMIYPDGDAYKLTPKGILFVNIFVVYRKIIKAGKGG
jgi:hypothetical protein